MSIGEQERETLEAKQKLDEELLDELKDAKKKEKEDAARDKEAEEAETEDEDDEG